MKLEPVAWIGQDAFAALTAGETICQTMTPSQAMYDDVPLTVIPPGYALVPDEATDEWITKMRVGTVEPQGMDAQAKIIQRLRDQYRKFITAAKGE